MWWSEAWRSSSTGTQGSPQISISRSTSDPTNPLRQVDLFVEHVVDFEELWERAEMLDLAEPTVRVASIPDLIDMKRRAGRPQDLADIEALEAILEQRSRSDG